jgi:hypothetical protein
MHVFFILQKLGDMQGAVAMDRMPTDLVGRETMLQKISDSALNTELQCCIVWNNWQML